MVIKVRDPKRWFLLPADEAISLEGQGRRPVRLEVNAVGEASFQAVYTDGTVAHLAAFQGMDTIEFVADGPVEVWVTSESDVYFYTDEGRNIAFVDDGKVAFTKPHERRGESEQIIYMQGLMLANMQRRNAQMEVYLAAAQAKEAESANSSGDGTGTVPPDSGTPVVERPADGGTEGVAGDTPAA
ncbi:MAG TPA: hypothetical protein VL147_10605 [Devosia sp.]|nr:hypothetical protein [Devosia sp.]